MSGGGLVVGAWSRRRFFPIRNTVKMLRVLKKVNCSRWSSQFYMFLNIFRNIFLIIWLVAFWTTGDRHVLLLVYSMSRTWWLKHIHQNNSLELFRFFQNFQTCHVAVSTPTFERCRRCFTIFCSPIFSPIFSRPYSHVLKQRLGSRPSVPIFVLPPKNVCFPPKTPRRRKNVTVVV